MSNKGIPIWASSDLEALTKYFHPGGEEDLGVSIPDYVHDVFSCIAWDHERNVVVARDEADNIYIIHGSSPTVIESYPSDKGCEKFVRTHTDIEGKSFYIPIS